MYTHLVIFSDIFFIGGFGTVAWIGVKEYENLQPDKIVVDGGEQNLRVNPNSEMEQLTLIMYTRSLLASYCVMQCIICI